MCCALLNGLSELKHTVLEVVQDTETKARVCGVSAVTNTFDYLFSNTLGGMILKHSDNLSRALQHEFLSAAEGQKIAQMTIKLSNISVIMHL